MNEIKTTSRTVLRRMLRDCDRELAAWDRTWRKYPGLSHRESYYLVFDARRREIRQRLKEIRWLRGARYVAVQKVD
jgi:hypothetical protein